MRLPTRALPLVALLACASSQGRQTSSRPGIAERVRRSIHGHDSSHVDGSAWRNWMDTIRLGEDMVLTPINTYHMRWAYPAEKIARYTEWPRGLGYGRARWDANGNRREVFGIIFEDSGGRLQYNIGYLFTWNTRAFGTDPDIIFGAGYVLMLMGRWDWSYLPIPLMFPVVSLGFARISIETTFVPGWEGYGNVFFTWVQFRL